MLELNMDNWEVVKDIQRIVNNRIEYITDADKYPDLEVPEYWEIIEERRGRGDCDDYVLTKRFLLRQAFPYDHDAFRIATCWDENGEYHAVLMIDTDRGTFVMDNRRIPVKPYPALEYKWHKIQRPDGSWFEY